MSLKIIVDSSCNLTKQEANEKGWDYIPLIININNESYFDGTEIDTEHFNAKVDQNSKVGSAASPPGVIKEVLDYASKNHDHVIVYALSSLLSSQTSNISNMASEYNNVHVIDSHIMSDHIIDDCTMAEKMFKKGIDIDTIVSTLNDRSKKVIGFFIPSNLDWLKKGGRINATTAALGKILNICPIIKYDGGMDKWGKGRTLIKTFRKGVSLLQGKIKNFDNYNFALCHSIKNKESKIYDKKAKFIEDFEKTCGTKIQRELYLPRILIIHTYFDAIGIIAFPKQKIA